jgi:hypothetical protein
MQVEIGRAAAGVSLPFLLPGLGRCS